MNIQELFDKIAEILAQFVGFFDTEAGGILETIKEVFASVLSSFGA